MAVRILNKIANWYFSKNALPYWCILTFDCLVVICSGILAHTVFHRITITSQIITQLLGTLCFYLLFFLVGFRIMHTYFGVLRFTSLSDIHRIAYANLIGVFSIAVLVSCINIEKTFIPFNIQELAVMFLLATVIMWSTRMIVKFFYDFYLTEHDAKKIYIYGVKNGGINLANSIMADPSYRLKGFISDADDMTGKYLLGLEVKKNNTQTIEDMAREGIDSVFVSPLKQASFIQNQTMIDNLVNAGISIYIMNHAMEWDGKSNITSGLLKEISIEDLLPRDEIVVDMKSVGEQLKDKCIMITGSAGSIGQEIVQQICQFKPRHLVLIDQAETPQHEIQLMMAQWPDIKAEVLVASICHQKHMESLFREYRPDYVFHAAAYKHVPMLEDNPEESIYNNIYGTRVIADLSVKYGVKKFVMISTDKAVNPSNVMGCSKRICEIYVQSLDKAIKSGEVKGVTQFVTTRFGNVLGSNGSVIPLFKEQIKNGGPVTVTHPDIIRYFMLIPEAGKLVLEAGTKGNGGEIFVFDMGKPVKIDDLAKRMIQLSGAKDIRIEYTGLRQGEKLYEELLNVAETTKPSFHEKIRIAKVREYDYDTICREIDELATICEDYDKMATVRKMKQIVPEFKSNNSIYEKLDEAQ